MYIFAPKYVKYLVFRNKPQKLNMIFLKHFLECLYQLFENVLKHKI